MDLVHSNLWAELTEPSSPTIEDGLFYATMIEYLNRSLGQDLKDDYGE